MGALLLRSGLWLLLGTWIGAWLCFGAVVAPTAFRVLPSTEIAGTFVGPVLTVLQLYGASAGIALALLALALRRGALLCALPLLLSALCLYSHFGLTAELTEVRDLAFGPGGSEAGAARYNELHRLSLRIFIGVGMAIVGLVPLHVRAETPRPD